MLTLYFRMLRLTLQWRRFYSVTSEADRLSPRCLQATTGRAGPSWGWPAAAPSPPSCSDCKKRSLRPLRPPGAPEPPPPATATPTAKGGWQPGRKSGPGLESPTLLRPWTDPLMDTCFETPAKSGSRPRCALRAASSSPPGMPWFYRASPPRPAPPGLPAGVGLLINPDPASTVRFGLLFGFVERSSSAWCAARPA